MPGRIALSIPQTGFQPQRDEIDMYRISIYRRNYELSGFNTRFTQFVVFGNRIAYGRSVNDLATITIEGVRTARK